MAAQDEGPVRLDLAGLNCPLPVLKSRRALKGLPAGARLTVVATDPMSEIDIPHMCAEDGHRLQSVRREGRTILFEIERG